MKLRIDDVGVFIGSRLVHVVRPGSHLMLVDGALLIGHPEERPLRITESGVVQEIRPVHDAGSAIEEGLPPP